MKISEPQFSMMQGFADFFAVSVGKILLKGPKSSVFGKTKDVQSVCNIAQKLLRPEDWTGIRGTVGSQAKAFAGALPTGSADDLLQVKTIG